MSTPNMRRFVAYITVLLIIAGIDFIFKTRFFALHPIVAIRDLILIVIMMGLVYDPKDACHPRITFLSLFIFSCTFLALDFFADTTGWNPLYFPVTRSGIPIIHLLFLLFWLSFLGTVIYSYSIVLSIACFEISFLSDLLIGPVLWPIARNLPENVWIAMVVYSAFLLGLVVQNLLYSKTNPNKLSAKKD